VTTNLESEILSHAERCAEGRSLWPEGPWSSEPDRVEWDTAAGLRAIALRHASMGHWCGYVGVGPGHPWHGVDLSADPDGVGHPDVHGGITYSEACAGAVCHVPAPGEAEALWWLGFDCAHSGDLSPYHRSLGAIAEFVPHGTYRTLAFVRSECERLAEQAAIEASR
jgi:hypothetical protein